MTHCDSRCRAAGLIVACLAGCLGLAGKTAGQVQLRVKGGRAACDGKVNVPVELIQPSGLGAMDVVFTYDPEKLAFEKAQQSAAVEDATFIYKELEAGKVRCGLISTTPIEAEGVVFTIQFQARGQAGETAVTPSQPQAWAARNAFVLRTESEGGTWTLKKPSPLTGQQLRWIAAGAGGIVLLTLVFVLGRRSARRSGRT